ncbi:rab effector Noc2-like [Brevipalpus obovatus]|uniref:rab effector Noc2-like n=1 Tax=Brevipalpus obovatus TaxID=246614 RepID=UPI003D9DB8DE
MSGFEGRNRWICPNDRELTLRAKLDTGWCVKSGLNSPSPSNQINEMEQQLIMDVLKRSEQIESMEKERVKRLHDRLNNMKRNAKGDGLKCCALCNDHFGLFSSQCHHCKDCNKAVCGKCGLDTATPANESIWLCKICSETREIWKKSGAWFSQKVHISDLEGRNRARIKRGSSSSSSSKNLGDYHQADFSGTKSHLSSPVIRRKTKSGSPRRFREAVNIETSEFGATLEVSKREDSRADLSQR